MDSDSGGKDSKKSSRGRGRGRGSRTRGRGRKKTGVSRSGDEQELNREVGVQNENEPLSSENDSRVSPKIEPTFDFEADITTTTPLTFVSHSNVPLHQNVPLDWNYKVNLMGEKVVNPRIHCCEKCCQPILVYGRMIPCKHVFCFGCAKANELVCPRCSDKVLRVEKSGLGTVFMCPNSTCKRTYLSQRDLEAHIQHRHVRRPSTSNPSNISAQSGSLNTSPAANVSSSSSMRKNTSSSYSNTSNYQSPIPVVSTRSNLITVPLQDDVNNQRSQQSSIMLSNQPPVSTYASTTQYMQSQHPSGMQWSSMNNNNVAFGYQNQWPMNSMAPMQPHPFPGGPYQSRPPFFQ